MSSNASTKVRHPSLLAELTFVRVQVLSEEPVVRAGIRCLLASRSQAIAFVDDADNHGADVVFYDVIGIQLRGSQDLQALVASHPGRVLALARTLQPGLTACALRLGATAAVPLGAEPEELLAAVHHLIDGSFQDGSAADVANRHDQDVRLGRVTCLSAREQQVLSLIVAGATNPDIAVQLHISANTLKTLIRKAYAKISVRSRSQAVAWGINHGFATHHLTPGTPN